MSTGYFAHESAYVDDGAVVGAGTRIWTTWAGSSSSPSSPCRGR